MVSAQNAKANTASTKPHRTGLMWAASLVASNVATSAKAFRSQAPTVHAASVVFSVAEPFEPALKGRHRRRQAYNVEMLK